MGRITAIRTGHGKQVKVFLNGKFAFRLEAEVALKENLRVGQELADGQIGALTRSDCFYRCLNAAAGYISYRARSEAELRERLYRRGFDGENVDEVIKRLKEQGLVDDVAFARLWRDNREYFSPRSRWLTGRELRQKGVAEDIIDGVVGLSDDNDSAYRAAAGKFRSLTRTDYQSFRRRLGDYLKRRGFSYGVTNDTVKRLWQELGGNID